MARKYGPELQKKKGPPIPPSKIKMNRQVLFSLKKSFDHTSLGFDFLDVMNDLKLNLFFKIHFWSPL